MIVNKPICLRRARDRLVGSRHRSQKKQIIGLRRQVHHLKLLILQDRLFVTKFVTKIVSRRFWSQADPPHDTCFFTLDPFGKGAVTFEAISATKTDPF